MTITLRTYKGDTYICISYIYDIYLHTHTHTETESLVYGSYYKTDESLAVITKCLPEGLAVFLDF